MFQRILTPSGCFPIFEQIKSKTGIHKVQMVKTNKYDIRPLQLRFETVFSFGIGFTFLL